jgi:hypothetical protein
MPSKQDLDERISDPTDVTPALLKDGIDQFLFQVSADPGLRMILTAPSCFFWKMS